MTILSHAKAAFLADSSRHSVVRGTSVFIVPLARHQVLTLQGVSSGAASLGATCVVVKAERAHDRRSRGAGVFVALEACRFHLLARQRSAAVHGE
jgi:hypothetical protein